MILSPKKSTIISRRPPRLVSPSPLMPTFAAKYQSEDRGRGSFWSFRTQGSPSARYVRDFVALSEVAFWHGGRA
jgi:hypothetical protein